MRKTNLLVLAMMIIGISSPVWSKKPADDLRGLEKLSTSEGLFEETLIHQGVDFSKYHKLMATDVEIEFRKRKGGEAREETGSNLRKRPKTTPNRRDAKALEKLIDDSVIAELEQCECFEIVNEKGPDTLMLRVSVLDLTSNIPPSSSKRRSNGLPYAAVGTILFDLVDCETGTIQARIGERRASRSGVSSAEVLDDSSRWIYLTEWAQKAARDLRLELERVWSENASSDEIAKVSS